MFKVAPTGGLLAKLPDLSEPGLQVRMVPSLEAAISVTMTMTHEPLSDDLLNQAAP